VHHFLNPARVRVAAGAVSSKPRGVQASLIVHKKLFLLKNKVGRFVGRPSCGETPQTVCQYAPG
jgi:hypothetical protein